MALASSHHSRLENHPKLPTPPIVLLVDDDTLVCDAVGRALAGAGFQVLKALDYVGAFDQLLCSSLTAAVVDLGLGESSGADLLSEIGRLQPHAARILISGEDPTKIAGARVRDDCDTYIRKPFSIDELVTVLGELGVSPSV